MSMIFHLVECLNCLGFKIKIEGMIEGIFNTMGAHEIIDHSFLLSGVDMKKIKKVKKYLAELKVDLKEKYFEKRVAWAKWKVDFLLNFIWGQIGISITDDALYPFRNAMITEFLNVQNLVYDEVIDELCRFLHKTRKSSARISISMDYIKMLLLPALLLGASMKHGGKGSEKCSDADKILMKNLSVMIKLGADLVNKR